MTNRFGQSTKKSFKKKILTGATLTEDVYRFHTHHLIVNMLGDQRHALCPQ